MNLWQKIRLGLSILIGKTSTSILDEKVYKDSTLDPKMEVISIKSILDESVADYQKRVLGATLFVPDIMVKQKVPVQPRTEHVTLLPFQFPIKEIMISEQLIPLLRDYTKTRIQQERTHFEVVVDEGNIAPYSSDSVKLDSSEAEFGKQLRKLLWKSGLILSPDIKLETEEEMVSFFKALSRHHLAPDEGEGWLLSTGIGLWNGYLNNLTIPVDNNVNWYEIHDQFHEWAKLPFEECAQKHTNFIKEHLNLTIKGEIKSPEDLSKIYVLLDGFNYSLIDKYSFINKEGDEWVL